MKKLCFAFLGVITLTVIVVALTMATPKTVRTTSENAVLAINDCPKIEEVHGINCDCDSLFGYQECDTLNFGGALFMGINRTDTDWDNNFWFLKTPKTETPYALAAFSQDGWGWRNVEAAISKNVKNFKWATSGKNLPERLKKYVINGNWSWGVGTQKGKEYFYSKYSGYGDVAYYLVITDLNLLKQFEQEQYELDTPLREAEAKEKLRQEEERKRQEENAKTFPF